MKAETEKAILSRLEAYQAQYEIAALKLAEEYIVSGRRQEALELLERLAVMAVDPEKKAFYRLTMGRLWEQLGEFEIAASYYSSGLSTEPQDKINWYFLHTNLAHCMNELQEFSRAEWFCREAIVIDPRRHHARKNLGVSLEGQGKLKEAVESYVDAVTVAPAEPQALLRLERLLHRHPEVAEEVPDLQARLEQCKSVLENLKSSHGHTSHPIPQLPKMDGHIPLIAILDDDETLIEVLGEEIRRRGGRYIGFPRKEVFLQQLGTIFPDLVLTDLRSPGTDGFALLSRLKADRRYADVPVIVVSGNVDNEHETEARRLGAFACLPKPFDVTKLFDTIHGALQQRSGRKGSG